MLLKPPSFSSTSTAANSSPVLSLRVQAGRARRRALRASVLCAAVLWVLACGQRESSKSPSGPSAPAALPPGTPVVLISIDTLRSDRLPAYGYQSVATPALDAFAADAVVFEHAYTPVPLTLPAHVSVLTGLDPPGHRVRDNAGYRLEADSIAYLPTVLHEAGYRTAAAVSSWVLRGTAGLSAGFDLYEDRITMAPRALLSGMQRSGFETLTAASDWLGEVADDPFFLFFHIYEPHTPHAPPPPYDTTYASPYDGEVAVADAIVGRLLDRLEGLGVYDRALIILLSDHGEGLNDHGDYEHGLLLYREVLQVPLLLKLPGSHDGGTRVERAVSLVDVFPTVLALLGLESTAGLDGRPLFEEPSMPEDPLYGETVFPRLHFGWSELYSLIDFPYHFIYGPDPELYDLASDPGERHNLVRSKRDVAAQLRAHLDSLDREIAEPLEEDDETRRKLAALGYIGTARGGGDDGPRADPKSQIHHLRRLKSAFTYYEERRYPEAEAEFRAVLAESPLLVDAWEQLGHTLTAQNKLEESLEPFERAMELSGGAPQVAGAIATVLLKLKRLEEARGYAELAADRHELTRDTLAQIAIRQGDLVAAETFVAEAVAGRGVRLGPLITEGELRLAQNRPEEVLSVTGRALEEALDLDTTDELSGLHFLRGSAFARMGRLEEAAAAYQREMELFPSDLEAYGRLALVRLFQGDRGQAAATLERMLTLFPSPAANAEAARTLRTAGDSAGANRLLDEALAKWPADQELLALRRAG